MGTDYVLVYQGLKRSKINKMKLNNPAYTIDHHTIQTVIVPTGQTEPLKEPVVKTEWPFSGLSHFKSLAVSISSQSHLVDSIASESLRKP